MRWSKGWENREFMARLQNEMAQFATALRLAVGSEAAVRWSDVGVEPSHFEDGDAAKAFAQAIPVAMMACRWLVRPVGAEDCLDLVEACDETLGSLLRAAISGDDEVGRLCRGFWDSLQSLKKPKVIESEGVAGVYESFLAAFDGKSRRVHGVYYTPRSLAMFMVRGVDRALKETFGLMDGLASEATWSDVRSRCSHLNIPARTNEESSFIRVLDPCTGCGTFLLEWLRQVWAKWRHRPHEEWKRYVFDRLLPNLEGRELMLVPYLVCRLQLVCFLSDTGLDREQCAKALRMVCGNTLLDDDLIDKRFTVIIGNPPYSGVSQNMAAALSEQVRSYLYLDGERIPERKTWLQDDYVKFVRLSQRCVERSGVGVSCLVTPSSYLDTPTFRGMRASLLSSFQLAWFLDLHGNSLRGDRAEDGASDPNIFGIRQGVAVHLLVRAGGDSRTLHSDLVAPVGGRPGLMAKLHWLATTPWEGVPWRSLQPARTSFWFLFPFEVDSWREYQSFHALVDVMPTHCTGIVTARDHFVLDDSSERLLERVGELRSRELPIEALRERYFHGKGSRKYPAGDSRGWRMAEARERLLADTSWRQRVRRCTYRPFDERYLYYTPGMVDWPRTNVMKHVDIPGNVMLITTRQASQHGGSWRRVAVSQHLVESCAISNKTREINYCFPMLVCDDDGQVRPNFSDLFLEACRASIGEFSTEELFGYVLSLLLSGAYQHRYTAFLRVDFPRIAVPSTREQFLEMARLGQAAVTCFTTLGEPTARLVGEPLVERPWLEEGGLKLSQKGGFVGVTSEVWEYRLGAYSVCEKWLRRRRGRILTPLEVEQFSSIVGNVTRLIAIERELAHRVDDELLRSLSDVNAA